MKYLMEPQDRASLESYLIRTLAVAAFALALLHVALALWRGESVEWAGIGAFLGAAAVPYLSASVKAALLR